MTAPDPPIPAGPVRPSPGPRPPARRVGWLFTALAFGLAGFAYRALWSWDPATHELPPLEGWIFLASERPPQAVFALALLLVLLRRRAIAAALAGPPAPWLASAALGVALALLAGSRALAATELALFSMVAFGLGIAWWIAGGRLAKELALPLAFLLFAAPFPDVFYLPLVSLLEQATAASAAVLLGALGIPAVREAQVLTLADDVFMIIETCSGAGSIAILLLLAAFWIGATRASWPHAILLLAFAPLLAFGLNALRVLALILTPGTVGAGLHALQGLILFQGGVLGLWLADKALDLLLPSGAAAVGEAVRDHPEGHPRRLLVSSAAGAGVAAALAAAVSLGWPAAVPPEPPAPWSMSVPDALLGKPGVQTAVDVRFLGSLRYGWMQHVQYGSADDGVTLFVASEAPSRPPRIVRSPKNRVPGRSYRVLSVESLGPGAPWEGGEEVLALHDARRVLSRVVYAGHAAGWVEAFAGVLGLRPPTLGTSPASRVLRMSTPAGVTRGELDRARRRLDDAWMEMSSDFVAK